jgi:hypothetical protein
MCFMCEENNGEPIGCQDCGVMICLDIEEGDDVLQPAGVTSSGDVYCLFHAMKNEEAAEEAWEEFGDYFEFDPLLDDNEIGLFPPPDSPGW